MREEATGTKMREQGTSMGRDYRGQLSDTSKFILLTLGAFFLSLGGAILLFYVIERLFFDLRGVGLIVSLSIVNVVLGVLLLLLRWRRST